MIIERKNMKNSFLKLTLSLATASSVALAQGAFIGYEGALSHSILKISEKAKDVRPIYGLRAGYDFDIYRIYGSYHYNGSAKDSVAGKNIKWTNHNFLVNADFTPTITDNVRLILGLYAGVNRINVKFNNTKETGSHFMAGSRIGAELNVNENEAFELGLKSYYTKYDVKLNSKKIEEINRAIYLGYTYKF